jgi:hypothetical protein
MLAATFHDALAVNIFMAIVNEFSEFLDMLTIADNHKGHPCMVQEQ